MLTITSNVEDTKAVVNGEPIRLPASLRMRRDQSISIAVERVGYMPVRKVVDSHLNTTGYLDIAGACLFLIPAIGLISPGSKSLSDQSVDLVLVPVDSTSSGR